MGLFFSYVALAIGGIVAITVMSLAFRLLNADKLESKKSAARASTWGNAIWGRTHIQDDHMPDARVRGGMVFNKKKQRLRNQWTPRQRHFRPHLPLTVQSANPRFRLIPTRDGSRLLTADCHLDTSEGPGIRPKVRLCERFRLFVPSYYRLPATQPKRHFISQLSVLLAFFWWNRGDSWFALTAQTDATS